MHANLLRSLAVIAAVALAPAAFAKDAVVGRESDAKVRARVVDLVNAARSSSRKCGRDAAEDHAHDMLKKQYFEHRGADGSQPKDRVLRAGYEPRLSGENIALGPESAEEVVAGWLKSPGHCANIMEPRFQDIGVGLASGKKRGQIYWVQTFGNPMGDRR
jgi:hypothetical protein